MRKQKIVRAKGLFVLIGAIVCFSFTLFGYSQTFAGSEGTPQGKPTVQLSSTTDLARLDVIKKELKVDLREVTYQTETLKFQIDPSSCFVYPAPDGYEYLEVGGLKPATKPGEPQLPMKTFIVELDKDAQVYGVEVIDGKFSELQKPINIIPTPEPSGWAVDAKGGKYIRDMKVYSLNKLFPGDLISYEIGSDSKRQYVYVRVFPVQYTPNQKKAIIVTEANINVYYGYGPDTSSLKTLGGGNASAALESQGTSASITSTNAQSIIICPASLQNEANALNNFHINMLGFTSGVITVETINTNYTPAPDPPFDGYKNSGLRGWRNIKNYNYTLAKKIVAYLRDTVAHPNLTYVTLLGEGLLVPPSYYYFNGDSDTYAAWIPTDYFYTSPGYDFTPDFRVGRISVYNASEASQFVNKINAWYNNANWSWFKKVRLAGGNGHTESGHAYCCERNIVQSINQEFFSGMNITKCFESDGTFTDACGELAFTTADEGMYYHIGHGNVGEICYASGCIVVNELLGYSANVEVPVVFSVACYAGAFDLNLYSKPGTASFGEAVLKSQAGGIAYIGGSRHNVGDSLYHYEQGNLVIDKMTYIVELLDNAFQNYHLGKNILGDICDSALKTFVLDNNMGDTVNVDTLFRHVLLGDPVLRIPTQQPATEYEKAVCTALNPAGYDVSGIPIYSSAPVTISATTNSPTVKWKLVNVNTFSTLDNTTIDYPPFEYTSNYGDSALYLVRSTTQEAPPSANYAKENWLFYSIGGQPAQIIHVSRIDMSVQTQGPNKYAVAKVTIVNSSNNPVLGATVSGHWSGLTSDSDSGVTDSNGQVSLSSNKVSKSVSGTFTFCVDNVTLTGGTYDPNANVETCDSIFSGPISGK